MQFIVTLAFIMTLVTGQQPVSGADPPRTGRVTAPTIIHKVDPEYSEAARAARIQGTVVVQVQISETGVPKVTRVVRSLGFGLDEKAIAAVTEWSFKPATPGWHSRQYQPEH